jgi:hypothetical protein
MDQRTHSDASAFDPEGTVDGHDREVLERLLDEAIDRGDRTEAASLIKRLSGVVRKETQARADEHRLPGDRPNVDDEFMDATDFVELVDI